MSVVCMCKAVILDFKHEIENPLLVTESTLKSGLSLESVDRKLSSNVIKGQTNFGEHDKKV